MTEIPAGERIWGGRTLDARRAARRTQLIDAALDLLAAGGGPALTVRAVCRHARLTERYFYESFADRDELALAVYDEVTAEALALIVASTHERSTPAEVARAAVEAMVDLGTKDPRKGKLLFVTSMTDSLLYAKRDELLPVVTALIREQVAGDTSDLHRDLVATASMGAIGNLFFQYFSGTLKATREEFVEHCVRTLMLNVSMPPG